MTQEENCEIDGRSGTHVACVYRNVVTVDEGWLRNMDATAEKSSRNSNSCIFKTTQNSALCKYTVLCTERGEK